LINVAATVKFNNLPKIAASARGQIGAVVRKTALDLETVTKESMQGQKSGLIYHRPGGAQHQSSAPGEAPAVDTGVLVNSIQDLFESELLAYVYTNTQYARYLEFGTAFMEARPFFKPAADQVRPAFLAAVKAVLGRV
jgi:HK97 gp10 family phage protein